MLSSTQDPGNALSWFRWYRRWAGGLVVVSATAGWSAGAGPPFWATTGLVCGFCLADLGETLWLRRRPASWRGVDMAAASALVAVALACAIFRAGDHPALSLLLQFIIPCALVLPSGRAWGACVALVVLHNGMVYFGPRLVLDDGLLHAELATRRLQAVLVFDVAAVGMTATGIGIRAALRDREDRMQRALDDKHRDERLIALGTMAAGIAHELGTPLSSIDLLAGEAQAEPAEAPGLLRTIRGQVSRCREILDRVRGSTSRTVSAEVDGFGGELQGWLRDWQAAGINRHTVAFELTPEVYSASVRGDPDTWRGSFWTLLDNALRAGGPLALRGRLLDGVVVIELDDSGPGPSPGVVAQAGEPFFTRWHDGGPEGRGLGLFVARAFARRWGGDITLTRRAAGGGRATIRLTTLTASRSLDGYDSGG